jgi:hypothetical protein
MMYVKGNEPTPDQRPYLAGFLAACIATLAAGWLLFLSGAIRSQAAALGIPRDLMIAVQAVIWLGGGVLFGRVFSRAAADPRGGWLFGISCGYLFWMLGPATTMMWIAAAPVAKGPAAIGLLAAYLLYGLVLGTAFPFTSSLFKPRLGEGVDREFNAAQNFQRLTPSPMSPHRPGP